MQGFLSVNESFCKDILGLHIRYYNFVVNSFDEFDSERYALYINEVNLLIHKYSIMTNDIDAFLRCLFFDSKGNDVIHPYDLVRMDEYVKGSNLINMWSSHHISFELNEAKRKSNLVFILLYELFLNNDLFLKDVVSDNQFLQNISLDSVVNNISDFDIVVDDNVVKPASLLSYYPFTPVSERGRWTHLPVDVDDRLLSSLSSSFSKIDDSSFYGFLLKDSFDSDFINIVYNFFELWWCNNFELIDTNESIDIIAVVCSYIETLHNIKLYNSTGWEYDYIKYCSFLDYIMFFKYVPKLNKWILNMSDAEKYKYESELGLRIQKVITDQPIDLIVDLNSWFLLSYQMNSTYDVWMQDYDIIYGDYSYDPFFDLK